MSTLSKSKSLRLKTAEIELPSPRLTSRVSLERSLLKRRSIREYSREPITLEALSQVLWSAQGITSSDGLRTTPSAGAIYPLEIYAAVEHVDGLAAGVYHYQPGLLHHRLELHKSGSFGAKLFELSTQQDFIRDVAVNILLTTVTARMAEKYGDAAERLVLLEMGHAAQNIHLQAEAMGLGSVAIGYLNTKALMKLLSIEAEPLYMVSVGNKKTG